MSGNRDVDFRALIEDGMEKMSTKYEAVKAAVDQAVERYASMDTLRAVVQFVPVVGGAIDTILSGRGSRLQLARLERFVGQFMIACFT